MSNSQSVAASTTSCLWCGSEELVKGFWQVWDQNRDYLYRRCLNWMGGNATDAEDALSRSMLKAYERLRDSTDVIRDLKAWLTRLTHNLCVDIHRECKRGTHRVESLDDLADRGENVPDFQYDTPGSVAMRGELETTIHRAIDDLPSRLRETCIMHFILELSYQEIAIRQGISYDNVCKRAHLTGTGCNVAVPKRIAALTQ